MIAIVASEVDATKQASCSEHRRPIVHGMCTTSTVERKPLARSISSVQTRDQEPEKPPVVDGFKVESISICTRASEFARLDRAEG